jgi:hypothetical protein
LTFINYLACLFINITKRIINKWGFVLVKKNKLKFDKNFNYSNLNLLEINIFDNYKLDKLITYEGLRLGSTKDLFYCALKKALKESSRAVNKKIFVNTFVKTIKALVKFPRNAAQAVRLVESKTLSSYPEWAVVFPWEDRIIDEVYNTYLTKFISKSTKLKKIYKNLDNRNKNKIIYSDEAWVYHAEQFFKLYKSMSINGFQEFNAIPINLFKLNNVFRISIGSDGNHRIRVAHVLNLKNVPLKVFKIIDFRDLNNWKNVKNCTYSKKNAKKIFKKYFRYLGGGSNV